MRSVHPGTRVLVEVTSNRWAFGTVLRTTASDAEVAIDGERDHHWWPHDRIRPVTEEARPTLDGDFFAVKAAS